MRAEARASARKYLDKRLNPLMNVDPVARPPRGWIKAIREALGMTTAQLAKRLGIAQPSAVGLEKAITPNGDVSLVGPYHPTTYAFNGYVHAMKPSDMAGWDTPIPPKR